jgi:hypothetical protein
VNDLIDVVQERIREAELSCVCDCILHSPNVLLPDDSIGEVFSADIHKRLDHIWFSRFPWDITLVNIFQVSRDMKALHSTIRQWRELHEQ